MGLMQIVSKASEKLGDGIAKTAALSPKQLHDIAEKRNEYLLEMPNPSDTVAQATTEKLLAANSIEVFNAYLPQISTLYVPLAKDDFDSNYNIRYFNITRWVTDKKEDSLEKLVNVYSVLSDETCNIALIFHRTTQLTQIYLAVTNTKNASNNSDADIFVKRLQDAVKGNFPGTEFGDDSGNGIPSFLKNNIPYSVAAASNIPTIKSEKFISQTVEKLLDGIIPNKAKEEYTLILLASPINDVEQRKLRLGQIYSGLRPYSSWQTNYTVTELNTQGSSATVGVNVGASAGIQNGQNSSTTNSNAFSDNESRTNTDSTNDSASDTISDTTSNTISEMNAHTNNTSTSNTASKNSSHTDSSNQATNSSANINIAPSAFGFSLGGGGASWGTSAGTGTADTLAKGTAKTLVNGTADTLTKSTAKTLANAVAKTTSSQVGHAVAKTLGKTVTDTFSKTAGVFSSTSFGVNFGMNFARSSNVSASIGKNEGIVQSFENYNIQHALELLEEQMKRLEQSTALGMWDFAAYVLSEDRNIANNVAHTYLSLTQGESSHMSSSAVNLWRGDKESTDVYAKTICSYLRELRHPVFGLNPSIVNTEGGQEYQVYPTAVTATTNLSGKELAYALNFPQKSIAGFPIIQCADFGRSVSTFDTIRSSERNIHLGKIFHMYQEEKLSVELSTNSLASHTFITGSTGSGKSNTIYQMLTEAHEYDIPFLVVEPAKGEYKHIFGNYKDVSIYSTNPNMAALLKINPFSFPKGIHVLEHLDRLVEIFNVCWPMYAAMPAVLKNAIEKSYEDCGWNLTESCNEYGDSLYPQFFDVTRNIKQIIDRSEYDSENKGAYKGSLLTRLQSLTDGLNGMIFADDEVPMEKLFDENVIIDLSRIGSMETKSLLMGMIVLKLQEYRMTIGKINAPLNHITVLEEAHNLLKRTSTEQVSESANLTGKSVEMISNAIAEMRTYGEGFIIADQAPGLLDMTAIRNTNTKIIMRLPDISDRELVGKAANLNEDQIEELAKLPCGVAAVYQNEWIQPVLCKIQKYEMKDSLYAYKRHMIASANNNSSEMIKIAELLSNGVKVKREIILTDIIPLLHETNISSSIKVSIINLLEKPQKEPRMTKLAPIMSALFPNVKKAVVSSYKESSNVYEWTKSAQEALQNNLTCQINDRTRRDIIQAIITDHVYNDLGNMKDLQKWAEYGGLR